MQFWRWGLTFLALCGVFGCAAHNEEGAAEFRVALVTPGPVSDAGWNAAAFAGLEAVEKQLGAATAHVEAGSPAEFEEAWVARSAVGDPAGVAVDGAGNMEKI